MKGRKTGGRQKGTKNKRTLELERRQEDEGLMPLDYMLKLMRDEKQPPLIRQDMAKAAAPYLHARRAPEDKPGNVIPPGYYNIILPE